ncbi:MAG: cysteine desulfurase family protein [Bacilli bacterium]
MNILLNDVVYLDNASTTPCDPRVVEAMQQYWFSNFGNPSSPHLLGLLANQVIEDCRREISVALQGSGTVLFTSGSTESNNLAIISVLRYTKERLKRNRVLCLSTEHKSVINSIRYFAALLNIDVEWIPVTSDGTIDANWLYDVLDESIGAVIVQLANSETGVIQDLSHISSKCHQYGAVCFSDITQAIGKIKIDIDNLGVDYASIAAHKFYGPKGIGALYVAPGMELAPLTYGGGQEKGIRPGTENVAGIVGMTTALRISIEDQDITVDHLKELRNRLWLVLECVGEIRWNGKRAQLLPSHLNITIKGVNAQDLLLRSRKVAFSAGSACNTATNSPSPVLLSMGMSIEEAEETIRLSVGRFNNTDQIDLAAQFLNSTIRNIRSCNSL